MYQEEYQRNEGKQVRIKTELKAIERRMGLAANGKSVTNDQVSESAETLEAQYTVKRAELASAVAVERRYQTQDPTVEKLGELLSHNPRGMMLLRDELSGWLLQLNKPGREGDREFFLEAWNGTGSFTVDRISRGTLHIPSLTVSVFGTIQPGKIKSLITNAIGGGMGDDGMLQRFQLLVYPDALPAWEKPTDWGDAEAKARADTIYAALDTRTPEQFGAQPGDIPYLRFSPAAQAVADQWRDELERRLRSGDLDTMPAFASHLSKFRSLMPALALIFYLIDVAAQTPGITNGSVGETHVRLAADWCDFLEAHARKLYAAETGNAIAAAHALADKILSEAVIDGMPVRDLHRKGWSGLSSPESARAGLAALADLGWLRMESRSTGANPSQVVRLHPDIRSSVEVEGVTRG